MFGPTTGRDVEPWVGELKTYNRKLGEVMGHDLTLSLTVAAVTGFITLLGVWLSHRNGLAQLRQRLTSERDQQERQAQRQRLEELYTLLGRWANAVVIHHTTYRKVMRGELAFNQALDITIARGVPVDAERLFTLAELYFPDEQGVIDELKALLEKADAVEDDFKERYKQGPLEGEKHASAITQLLIRFNAAIDGFRAQLVARARST